MKLQRKSVRDIAGYSQNAKPEYIMEKFGIQPVDHRWKAAEAIWLFKRLNMTKFSVPNYLEDLIPIRESVRSLRGEARVEANCKTSFGESMLSRRIRTLTQKLSLSHDLWKCDSIAAFKSRVFTLISL